MSKYIIGLFDDDEKLLHAAREIRKAGVKIMDVFTPFPVHGLDAAIGLKESRLHTVGFIAGACGAIFALSFIIWTNTVNYPINFGGKPYLSLPSYIPITFEVTVLSAAVTMVIAFFVRCGLSLVKEPRIFDPRTTDDKFAMVFAAEENDAERVKMLLKQLGAEEVNEKHF
ncbi:MAG: membrane protein [Chitinophagales bacterium]|nr:MAG: membrane protein [Chitinophagales bacterium]